jgi:hypothetical protein
MNVIAAWGEDENTCRFAEQVVEFCVRKLMPRMTTLDICINIEEDCDVYGYCLAVNKREFVIEVKQDLSAIDFITTLAHEVTHIKQWAKNELPIDYKADYTTQAEYENQICEIEAYRMERLLTAEFLKEFYGK